MPSEPVSAAARSDSTSPNRLSPRMTSNCFGREPAAWRSCRRTCARARHRELGLVDLAHHGAPEAAGLHDVRLLDAGHLVAALARQLEGHARDAGDLVLVVDLGVEAARLPSGSVVDAARLAEIDAARGLAHDHDVEAAHQIGLQRGGIHQRVEHHGRAQVGEQAEILAQPQDAELRRCSKGRLSHFGPPTEPNSTASAPSRLHRLVRAGRAGGVDRAPPTRPSSMSKLTARRRSIQSMTRRVSRITSGPMPSPGRTGASCWRHGRSSLSGRRRARAARPSASPRSRRWRARAAWSGRCRPGRSAAGAAEGSTSKGISSPFGRTTTWRSRSTVTRALAPSFASSISFSQISRGRRRAGCRS
jgi:hypothetical protein